MYAVLALLLAEANSGSDYSTMKVATLKRMLFIRGVSCDHCTAKADWVAQMKLHDELPEQPELAAEWTAQKEYAKNIKEFNMTRDEFLTQMHASENNPLDGARAERLWATFQEQLREGAVDFLDDGSIRFAMPLTHRISPYLPTAAVDAIEWAASWARQQYTRLLSRRRRVELEAWLDWSIASGAVYAAIAVLLTMMVADVLLERRHSRRDRDEQLDEKVEELMKRQEHRERSDDD